MRLFKASREITYSELMPGGSPHSVFVLRFLCNCAESEWLFEQVLQLGAVRFDHPDKMDLIPEALQECQEFF
jgi:hypothetical protein